MRFCDRFLDEFLVAFWALFAATAIAAAVIHTLTLRGDYVIQAGIVAITLLSLYRLCAAYDFNLFLYGMPTLSITMAVLYYTGSSKNVVLDGLVLALIAMLGIIASVPLRKRVLSWVKAKPKHARQVIRE